LEIISANRPIGFGVACILLSFTVFLTKKCLISDNQIENSPITNY